ncbi:MAG: GNAT family N-acetyltransferase [Clostridia bacterium]|nr:GNAT family N-acetyltransferase [Clostridia bacterium]
MHLIAPLFADMEDTTILSGLQGRNGGIAFADSDTSPRAAMIIVGGRRRESTAYCFAAGDYTIPTAQSIVRAIPDEVVGQVIIVPQNDGWCGIIEQAYGKSAKRTIRYATSKADHHFDAERLREGVNALPEGYSLSLMGGDVFDAMLAIDWACDNVANFDSGADFEQNGLGVMCLRGDEIVGAASSFTAYDKGIEIEIATAPPHRRKGIARACASMLLLECMERGLYPSWDAANEKSLGLARSLGYVFAGEYTAYVID